MSLVRTASPINSMNERSIFRRLVASEPNISCAKVNTIDEFRFSLCCMRRARLPVDYLQFPWPFRRACRDTTTIILSHLALAGKLLLWKKTNEMREWFEWIISDHYRVFSAINNIIYEYSIDGRWIQRRFTSITGVIRQ